LAFGTLLSRRDGRRHGGTPALGIDKSATRRFIDALPVGLAGGIVVLAIWEVALHAQGFVQEGRLLWFGTSDFWFYREVGARWLETGTLYLPDQLAAGHQVALMQDVLYPPTALYLFVPLVFVPPPTWWLIPLLVVTASIWHWRPNRWSWPILALLVAWPRTEGALLLGNTDLWVAAGVAGGLRWGWPAAFVLLKPSFAFLALLGVRFRAWRWSLLIVVALSAPLVLLWFDYIRVLLNTHVPIDYSLMNLPIIAIPILAWVARTQPRARPLSVVDADHSGRESQPGLTVADGQPAVAPVVSTFASSKGPS